MKPSVLLCCFACINDSFIHIGEVEGGGAIVFDHMHEKGGMLVKWHRGIVVVCWCGDKKKTNLINDPIVTA